MMGKISSFYNKISDRLEGINNSRLGLILLISVVTCLIKVGVFYSFYSLGEIWFDEGYLYYGSVLQHGFLRNLTIADASYLNMVPRIISIILIKIFGATLYFPELFKVINIYVFGLFISFLLLKEFDEYFGPKLPRLIIATLLILFPHQDMASSYNSSYACIVPIMWFLIKFNCEKTVEYKFYPLYLVSIVIVFICKPLISIATIAVTFILLIGKLCKKDYRNIFLLLFAIGCAIFHLIYIKYMGYLHIYPIDNNYFEFSYSAESLFKILNFAISSIGISLFGYSFLAATDFR